MNKDEWESLCDGCGLCCMVKLQDEDTNEVFITNVGCRYLDVKTCRCKDYENRHRNVKDCIELTPKKVETLDWLPETCAYRLIDEGNKVIGRLVLLIHLAYFIDRRSNKRIKRIHFEPGIEVQMNLQYRQLHNQEQHNEYKGFFLDYHDFHYHYHDFPTIPALFKFSPGTVTKSTLNLGKYSIFVIEQL